MKWLIINWLFSSVTHSWLLGWSPSHLSVNKWLWIFFSVAELFLKWDKRVHSLVICFFATVNATTSYRHWNLLNKIATLFMRMRTHILLAISHLCNVLIFLHLKFTCAHSNVIILWRPAQQTHFNWNVSLICSYNHIAANPHKRILMWYYREAAKQEYGQQITEAVWNRRSCNSEAIIVANRKKRYNQQHQERVQKCRHPSNRQHTQTKWATSNYIIG